MHDSDAGEMRLHLDPLSSTASWLAESASARVAESSAGGAEVDLLIAGEWASADGEEVVGRFYNGKIEAPSLFSRALSKDEIAALRNSGDPHRLDGLAAAWDFSADISSRRVSDVSGHGLHGATVQMPMRAATGHGWDGSELDWRHAPEQYGAIHFHDDDLDDAGWEVSIDWTVPDEVASGVYAVHLQAEGEEDYIPFVICPRRGRPTAKIAYVLPTFSYLAYANYVGLRNARRKALADKLAAQRFEFATTPQLEYVVENRLLSCYDLHSDGSGVCYSSRLRPVLGMRPKIIDDTWGVPHQFCADLYLVDWLQHQGYEFDVFTDDDLHQDGLRLVEPYNVVLTATHCEYWSSAMIDAMQQYLNGGGRFMSLTGNNFHWVTQLDPEEGHTIEVRRPGPASRPWDSEPGEAHLSTTGEPGGLWRYRHRSPQSWTGLVSTSDGGGTGRPFARQPDSFDPRAEFIFEGVGADELIGDFSHLMGYGAAGLEFDRLDYRLGTPPGTLLLATANGFSDEYRHLQDAELGVDPAPPRSADDPLLRADMVLLEYPNGGMVFNPGSINWCGCLSRDNYENNVSRITQNVLDRFAGDRGTE